MSNILSKLHSLFSDQKISIEELEFARFLNDQDGESEIPVIIGASVLYYHLNGHICTDLNEILEHEVYGELLREYSKPEIVSTFLKSALVSEGNKLAPLVLEEERIYLHRFWKYEKELSEWLLDKSKKTQNLDKDTFNHVEGLFQHSTEQTDWQKTAVLLALIKDLVIISGGPGTGKTYTIKKLIEAFSYKGEDKRIALTAPTGKAAQKLTESFESGEFQLEIDNPKTIHKLLGARGVSGEFKYNNENQLPYDVVIVDEASMLDITMWIRLTRSIHDDCKLIVLGDKNQLASVEAGSILGDICWKATHEFSNSLSGQLAIPESINQDLTGFNDSIVLLQKNHRFGENSGIQLLAEAINNGDAQKSLELLQSDDYPEIQMAEPSNEVLDRVISEFAVKPFMENMSSGEINFELYSHQILCALRKGPFGVEYVNSRSENRIKSECNFSFSEEWYPFRSIIITRNNAANKLSNGEFGIYHETKEGGFVFFENRDAQIPTSRINNYESAYAITVHKSQGSEYKNVAILLSDSYNRVLTKELLYTSVTRARFSILVIGSADVISHTITQNISRKSGFKQRIWKDDN